VLAKLQLYISTPCLIQNWITLESFTVFKIWQIIGEIFAIDG